VPATAPTAPAKKSERALSTGARGITPAFPPQWFAAHIVLSVNHRFREKTKEKYFWPEDWTIQTSLIGLAKSRFFAQAILQSFGIRERGLVRKLD
jgi:hypothetical protein